MVLLLAEAERVELVELADGDAVGKGEAVTGNSLPFLTAARPDEPVEV